jgi:hypothetical protein
MKVHFMGLDFTHYDKGEGEHVTIEMAAPPAKGTRIIFNGGLSYVVSHEPEYFINTGRVLWNDQPDQPADGWIEACWVLCTRDTSPEDGLKRSVDPRDSLSDEDRERFDRQIAELMASVMNDNEPDPNCPQCGRPCTTMVWRQDECWPRGNERCGKSHDQMQTLRAIKNGC